MISIFDFIQDLANPALGFLPRALMISVLSAIVCGVVGTHVVLRGMAFIGDAVAHSVFPGIAVAFALQTSVIAGGAVAGVVVAVLIAVFSQRRRVKEDTLIGVFFAGAFALGLVVISQIDGYTASLTNFLFGSIAGVSDTEIVVAFVLGTAITALLLGLNKELVAVSLDRETAMAQRLPVFALDLVLYLAVTCAVVISVRTIGNILVLALLVTPAASARLLTDRLTTMMAASVGIGVASSVVGLYLSWAVDVPTGATIVLVATAIFLLCWLFAPRRGVLTEKLSAARRMTRNDSAHAAEMTAVQTDTQKELA
nr:anchored repeat-type ABC transporter permease subunit [Corynebacterium lactis]